MLDYLTCAGGELLIVGDFNFHFENKHCHRSRLLRDLLSSFGLVQHVDVATHQSGHALDLLITKDSSRTRLHHNVTDFGISDHYVLLCELTLTMPRVGQPRPVRYRNLKRIDATLLNADILESSLSSYQIGSNNLNAQVLAFNQVLTDLLDKHAPVKSRVFPHRDR